MAHADKGWNWFDTARPTPPTDAVEAERENLAAAFARCFHAADGARVLGYLKSLTVERALGPGATDALLRHVEGQRQLVAHILALVDRGRKG